MLVTYPSLLNKIKQARAELNSKLSEIAEITPKWESKKREFEELSHQVEEAEKARMLTAQKDKELKALIDGKRLLIKAIDAQITEAKSRLKGVLVPKDALLAELKEQITYLESVLRDVEKGIVSVKEKEEEFAGLVKKIELANSDLASVNKKLDTAKNNLNSNIEKSEEVKKEVVAVVNQAKSQMESAKSMLDTVDQEFKRVEFYARRLKKLYTAKGWPIPEDLGDFQSTKVAYSHKTALKIKQNV